MVHLLHRLYGVDAPWLKSYTKYNIKIKEVTDRQTDRHENHSVQIHLIAMTISRLSNSVTYVGELTSFANV